MEDIKNNIDKLSLSKLLDYIKICDYELENLNKKRSEYISLRPDYNLDYLDGLIDFNSVIKESKRVNGEIENIDRKIEYYNNLKEEIKKKILTSPEYIKFQQEHNFLLESEEQPTDKKRL